MKNFFFGVSVGVCLTFLIFLLLPQTTTFLRQLRPEQNQVREIDSQSSGKNTQDSQEDKDKANKIGRHTQDFIKSLNENKPATEKTISTADFEIVSFRGEWEYGRLRVIGEIKNNGKIAAGVEVEAIARDPNGTLIESTKFWPNSISNIPPGSSTGISHTITEDRRASRIELRIVRVTMW